MKSTALKMVAALTLLSVVACATSFPYRRYALDVRSGTLLAAEEDGSQDKPISSCIGQKGSLCVVFFTAEYARMKADYEDAVRRLKKCGTKCR